MSEAQSTPGLRVGLDTNILIYAFSNPKSDDEKALAKSSKRLLESLEERKCRICISIISIAEYLAKVEVSRHTSFIQRIESRYQISGFSLHAASQTARIFGLAKKPAKAGRTKADRVCLAADCKIIGSLFADRVVEVYTNDKEFMELASNVMTANMLSDTPYNLFQFGEDEADKK